MECGFRLGNYNGYRDGACLEKQILMEGYDMEIARRTGRPQEILEAMQSSPRRGIYFLDMELKGEPMDGAG